MGDFVISEETYKNLGIEVINLTPEKAKEIDATVTEAEVDALIASDNEKYNQSEDLPQDVYRRTARGSLVVRKFIEENNLTAFSANFLKVDEAFGIG